MKLFIFTYPLHSELTKHGAIFALENIKDVDEIIYVCDDLFYKKWTHSFPEKSVIKFSSFDHTTQLSDGWYRQQFAKLQLHKITTDESFYILDGDTLIRNPINLLPNKMIKTLEFHSPYFDFIDHSLNLQKNNDFSFVSPLIKIDRRVLVELEKYSLSLNGYTIFEMLLEYEPFKRCNNVRSHFSEAEIYGTFSTQVLNIQYEYIDSTFRLFGQNERTGPNDFEEAFLNTNVDLVWGGHDYSLPKTFWKSIAQKTLQ